MDFCDFCQVFSPVEGNEMRFLDECDTQDICLLFVEMTHGGMENHGGTWIASSLCGGGSGGVFRL